MSIGRNDICPCGSGKKYKKCCLNRNVFETWKENAFDILEKSNFTIEQKNKLIKTFFIVLEGIQKNNIEGACHSSSSVLYVLLNEYGFSPRLCIGEVLSEQTNYRFDHSWIEVDSKVFDAAIMLPLTVGYAHNVVFYGDDIVTMEPIVADYGHEKGKLDSTANYVYNSNFNDYMDAYPFYPEGLWGMVRDFSEKIGKPLDISLIKEKYAKVKRSFIN